MWSTEFAIACIVILWWQHWKQKHLNRIFLTKNYITTIGKRGYMPGICDIPGIYQLGHWGSLRKLPIFKKSLLPNHWAQSCKFSGVCARPIPGGEMHRGIRENLYWDACPRYARFDHPNLAKKNWKGICICHAYTSAGIHLVYEMSYWHTPGIKRS